uniref:Methionine adenosyltransferase 2 subunit beta n=1 Tax=Saimiri boliviensis boliviensis TaxID=39432 RepID=A0A2K6V1L6_SAIBB
MVGREKELSIHFVPGSCRLVEEEVNIPNRRVLVTGATGLLGRAVHKEFQQNNWHAVGCGFRRARPKFEQVNLLDSNAVHHIIHDFQLLLEHFSSTLAQIMYLMEQIHLTERKTYQLH